MHRYGIPQVGLLALDLDGTVLDSKYAVRPKTLRAIREASQKIPVVIVTGRMWQQTQQYAELFGIRTACICGQGALTLSPNGQVKNRRIVKPTAVNIAIETARSNKWDALFYFGGSPYAEFLSPTALNYVDVDRSEVGFVKDLGIHVQKGCEKVVYLIPDTAKSEQVKSVLRNAIGATSRVVSASENLVEVIDPTATKGAALKELCAELGIPSHQVMVIGDSETDMDMFAVAGMPIAVESAPPEVKTAAMATCKIPEQDGVAEIIQQFHIIGSDFSL